MIFFFSRELNKKHGPIFTFRMGPDNWLAICDFKLFKEAMHRDEFQDRPSLGALADTLFPVIQSAFYFSSHMIQLFGIIWMFWTFGTSAFGFVSWPS